MKSTLHKWLREPLVQFMLAGLLIFVVWGLAGGPRNDAERIIVIDQGQAERLVAGFFQTWRRPPTEQELDSLIQNYVREEVYYREAKRLGLDLDDAIIRRRLRSKMEFISEAQVEAIEPNDAALKAWFNERRDRYAAEVSYSFDQVFLDLTTRKGQQQRADKLLKDLNNGVSWEGAGDPISLPASLTDSDRDTIVRDFGEAFADELDAAPIGRWAGPIRSGFGLHLVRVRKREASEPPSFSKVRERVENDWRFETVRERQDEAYRALLKDYEVRIDLE